MDLYSFEQVDRYIKHSQLPVSAEFAYDYWHKKNWKTKKKEYVKNLKIAVGVANGIWLKAQGKSNQFKKNKRKKIYQPYQEQLNSPQWKAFRSFIFAVRGRSCEKCGSSIRLQIHHREYIDGRKAWEYSCDEVVVLCNDCHEISHCIDLDKAFYRATST